MGQHCELMAQEWGISRAEQDQLAYESHRKAAKAYRSGFIDDLVVPFAGVFRDNNVRADTTLEKMATLKPAFDKSERGTLTAANSTPLTDGASAVLLASEEWAAKRALPVLAYLTYSQISANNFVEGEGLLMAPDDRRLATCSSAHSSKLQDFDFYEIHEAFAAQVLATLKAWEDPDYCRKYLGRDDAAGRDRPRQDQRQGLEPRLRPPLRGDRRAHRGQPRQAARRERRARAHLACARPAAWASPPSWRAARPPRCAWRREADATLGSAATASAFASGMVQVKPALPSRWFSTPTLLRTRGRCLHLRGGIARSKSRDKKRHRTLHSKQASCSIAGY